MYTFQSKVRYSEINPQGVLGLDSIINYFQDCSTFQSEELGVGVKVLEKEHRVWLMNSWQVVLVSPPALSEPITVGTWAYDFKALYGYRNFILQDGGGTVCAYANSIWVYYDTRSGRPCRIPEDMVHIYPVEPPYPMEHAPRKIGIPENLTGLAAFPVPPSSLDTNRHVNNCEYVRMAMDCLPTGFSYRQMRAEYRRSALPGDSITPRCHFTDTCCTVVLSAADGQPFAVVEFSACPFSEQQDL